MLFLCILVFSAYMNVFGQERAVGTYSINGKLIGITNLSGLSDCEPRSVSGKVKDIDVSDSSARIRVKENKVNVEVAIPLQRVAPDDRKVLFHHLITKKVTLRIAGYMCSTGDVIRAFSIDRVY